MPVRCLPAILAAILSMVTPCLGAGGLLGASSREHIWIVLPPQTPLRQGTAAASSDGGWKLLHVHPAMSAGVRVAMTFESAPSALAAWGDRVWVAFPSAPGDDSAGEVWTLRAVHNAALNTWFNEPLDRLELRPALPPGVLEAFAADVDGPVALLRGDGSARSLVRLRGDDWLADEAAPPDGEAQRVAGARTRIACTGFEGSTLVLVDDGSPAAVWLRRPREGWTSMADGLPRPAVALAATSELVVAAVGQGELTLFALRGDRPLVLGSVPEPAGEWCLLGVADGLRLVAVSAKDGSVELHRIDPRRPEAMTRLDLGTPRERGAQWMHVPVLGGLALGVAMLLLLVCSDRIGAMVALPTGLVPVDLPQRAMGAVIDYLPAALIVWRASGCPALDLITLPIWTMPFDRAAPPLAALLLSVLIAGVTEAIWGTSLGKRFAGARVVQLGGGRPAAWRSLLRALLKFIVLSLPVLGVFHLLNPQKRGLPELLTGTTVLHPPRESDGSSRSAGDS